MFQIGKKKEKLTKKNAFSLVEIIVSLAIFSFIITSVVAISLQMTQTQKKIQAKLFLAQTSQTLIESMSRQIRYGYFYSGDDGSYAGNNGTLTVNTSNISTLNNSNADYSQDLSNKKNSPYVVFESQGGNPNDFKDQMAFCVKDSKLYRVNAFIQDTTASNVFKATCDTGAQMVPDSITVEAISFDIYGGDSAVPKNPTVRIKMRLKHEEGGTMDIQTSVTQRLVTYF
jgi:type II secretory pathway pseudopilin PulG